MSDSSGGTAQAAVDFAKFVIGTNTSQAGSGQTASQNSATTTGASNTETTGDSKTLSTTSNIGDVLTTLFGSTSTTASADPGVISSLKALAAQAISNSNDPSKTTGLISGLLQTAGDAMTQIFGQQKQAGIYDSSSAAALTGNVQARATADAAAAVLGYQSGQETIAGDALKNLLTATATSTTNTNSTSDQKTNQLQTTNTDVATNSESINNFTSSVDSRSATANNTVSGSSTKPGVKLGTIVCTWMIHNKLLSFRRYYVVSDSFHRSPIYHQEGYHAAAKLLVRTLERDHTTRISRAIITIFSHRTEYVCACRGLRGCRKTWFGFFCKALVAVYCTPTGLWFMALYYRQKLIDKLQSYLVVVE